MVSRILRGKFEGTYKWRKILEAIRFCTAHANGRLIAQHERNLDDAGQPSRHQRVSENRMDHCTDHQCLGVRRHRIASQQNHQGRNKIPLRAAVTAAAQPHTQQTGTPPDDTHRSVLEIIVGPFPAPAMLGKGIDTAPSSDNQRIEEFLASTRPAQPVLPNQQENSQTNTVPDERRAHDEMRQTLSEVVTLTETQSRNSTKEHLRP